MSPSSAPDARGVAAGAVQSVERRRALLAALAFFLILCCYYILRPVRDAMGSQSGASRLPWLFTGTFVATTLVVPLFGWLVRHVPRSRLLPTAYGFLVANLLGFVAAFAIAPGTATAATYFIWLSVFNLFVISLFWSDVSDSFTTEQAHRLYGAIAAGGTVGALAGPSITSLVAERVGIAALLALSAALLALAAACMVALRRGRSSAAPIAAPAIGGSILAGITLALRVPRLRSVAWLVVFYTTVSTVLYIEIADHASQRFPDAAARTGFFATVDLAVNGLALATQTLVTRRLVLTRGLRVTLSIVPLVVLAGLGVLGAWQTFALLVAVQIVHRAGEYSLARPGREMIYTTVDAEARYKAKNVIDTTVYRANDAASSWLIAAVRGLGWGSIVLVGIPAACGWLATAYHLGRRHDRHEST